MFSTFITVTLFVSLVIRGASAGFAISTPKLIQCQPVEISWAPTSPPYEIEVVPASNPCGDAFDTIGSLTSTTLNYASKFASGTQVVLFISDAAGNEAWSGNITIGTSSNSSCIPGISSISIPSSVPTPVVNPVPATHAGSSASSSSSSGIPLGGAINAGSSPFNGASSARQASTPLISIMTLAAMLALTL